MSRTIITKCTLSRTGVAEATTKIPAAGIQCLNDGKVFYRLSNTHSGAVVTTFAIAAGLDGNIPAGKTVTQAAGEIHYIGPFPTSLYNQSGGWIYLDADVADKVDVTPLYIETVS